MTHVEALVHRQVMIDVSTHVVAVNASSAGLMMNMTTRNCLGQMNMNVPLEINIPAGEVVTVPGTSDGARPATKVQVTLHMQINCRCANMGLLMRGGRANT